MQYDVLLNSLMSRLYASKIKKEQVSFLLLHHQSFLERSMKVLKTIGSISKNIEIKSLTQ